ncbi:hypothetical protein AB0C34_28035 [Nocardia sp. NPDC049220]|uniref:hypothetical protein n=1 Tax=Nocardia sp. NPDC049220 TaxID=3155273 RepID=UPI0033C2B38F
MLSTQDLAPARPSLLIELDKRTGLPDCFTHATGKRAGSPALKRTMIAVLLASSDSGRAGGLGHPPESVGGVGG